MHAIDLKDQSLVLFTFEADLNKIKRIMLNVKLLQFYRLCKGLNLAQKINSTNKQTITRPTFTWPG
jgi:hypothetical protein